MYAIVQMKTALCNIRLIALQIRSKTYLLSTGRELKLS